MNTTARVKRLRNIISEYEEGELASTQALLEIINDFKELDDDLINGMAIPEQWE